MQAEQRREGAWCGVCRAGLLTGECFGRQGGEKEVGPERKVGIKVRRVLNISLKNAFKESRLLTRGEFWRNVHYIVTVGSLVSHSLIFLTP